MAQMTAMQGWTWPTWTPEMTQWGTTQGDQTAMWTDLWSQDPMWGVEEQWSAI
jgi:hypothetical protein